MDLCDNSTLSFSGKEIFRLKFPTYFDVSLFND